MCSFGSLTAQRNLPLRVVCTIFLSAFHKPGHRRLLNLILEKEWLKICSLKKNLQHSKTQKQLPLEQKCSISRFLIMHWGIRVFWYNHRSKRMSNTKILNINLTIWSKIIKRHISLKNLETESYTELLPTAK